MFALVINISAAIPLFPADIIDIVLSKDDRYDICVYLADLISNPGIVIQTCGNIAFSVSNGNPYTFILIGKHLSLSPLSFLDIAHFCVN